MIEIEDEIPPKFQATEKNTAKATERATERKVSISVKPLDGPILRDDPIRTAETITARSSMTEEMGSTSRSPPRVLRASEDYYPDTRFIHQTDTAMRSSGPQLSDLNEFKIDPLGKNKVEPINEGDIMIRQRTQPLRVPLD